jgi:hypothetical protein
MDAAGLLKATERAVGAPELIMAHNKLVELGQAEKNFSLVLLLKLTFSDVDS